MKYQSGDQVISKNGASQYPLGEWTGVLTITGEVIAGQVSAKNAEGRLGWFYEENLLPVSTETMFREFSDEDMEMELHRRKQAKRNEEVRTLVDSAVIFLENGGFALDSYDVQTGALFLDLSEFDN